ncbi:hypothetical protein LEP1GSC201_1921 [Leptospira interrogans serovar Pomona str. Fox 32256]|nr:hypothetical protein LEP1GSC014_2693 [Leptospira interrogans serovar Pomona str. Pomona]EMF33575.1 hypothetical protein LEP1GSC201_1921 [Leptospira interrogans serovar Pomona str. Fox 32256]EMN99943.1 hypothetical protein LEP1GSC112_0529 [Leptospira interrogans serovar Pomona str. UT364]
MKSQTYAKIGSRIVTKTRFYFGKTDIFQIPIKKEQIRFKFCKPRKSN